MTEPMSLMELDEIRDRAAHLAEYEGQFAGDAEQLAAVDVPHLLDEVERLYKRLDAAEALAVGLGDELGRLADQVARVRERHQPNEHGNCANRCYTPGLAPQPSPCPTLRDLGGES